MGRPAPKTTRALLLLVGVALLKFLLARSREVVFKIFNHDADQPVSLYWRGFDGELVPQLKHPLRKGENAVINSFPGHSFTVCWAGQPAVETEECAAFTVGEYEFNLFVNKPGDGNQVQISVLDTRKASEDVVGGAFQSCKSTDVDCLTNHITEAIWINNTKPTLELANRKEHVTEPLRVAACADARRGTSEPVETRAFGHQGKGYKYRVLLDRPGAQIGVAEDFVSEAECRAMRDIGEGRLQMAVTSTAGGGTELSSARRALAHMINPDLGDRDDALTQLYEKAYAFANEQTGYGLSPWHQEGINLIKYEPGMEYVPHCDGNCAGRPLRRGGRVATMIFYCGAADEGGATTFTRAGIHVLGQPGQAVFFSYMDPTNSSAGAAGGGTMDTGLTYHSGCPVVEGEKWIATMWMRAGLTAECPWASYDPEGHPFKKKCAVPL